MIQFWKKLSRFERAIVSALVVVALGCAVGIYEADKAAKDAQDLAVVVAEEGRERRHQMCQIFESSYRRNVASLRNTYSYLEELDPDKASDDINRAIIRQLPETRERARSSRPPDFCLEKNIGLPGPNPRLPKRPNLDHLLN